eukprot:jgi/Mesen1/9740/ME000695S09046
MRILVTGGSGYLGQFIVKRLRELNHDVTFTYRTSALSGADLVKLGEPKAIQINLADKKSLINLEVETPDVVVNCAAISVPRECEQDPEAAYALNVPHALVSWLKTLGSERQPLLIHLSTDQVYDGQMSFWREGDATEPVNAYGRTKVAAEALIRDAPLSGGGYAILRSSIIVGPAAPAALAKTLPLQWINETLAGGKGAPFFCDEFRCPVFVGDIVRAVEKLLLLHASRAAGKPPMRHVFNLGGPDRLSRAEMAGVVADVRGHDRALVQLASAASASRGVVSPQDISMDCSHLVTTLGMSLTPFREAVEKTFGVS